MEENQKNNNLNKYNLQILRKKKHNTLIKISLEEVFNEDSLINKKQTNKKDLNSSITESDSDTEKQNLIFINNKYNKNKKRIKWTKEENLLFIEAFLKYKNNFKKIKKFVNNKPINNIRSRAKKFLNRIKKIIGDSQKENEIKFKLEEVFKRQLKRKYDSSYLPDFILYLFENVLSFQKKSQNDIKIFIKNEKEELSTIATTENKTKTLPNKLLNSNKENQNCLIQSPKNNNNTLFNNNKINKSTLVINDSNNIEKINNKNDDNNLKNINNYIENIDEILHQNDSLYDYLYQPSIISDNQLYNQNFRLDDFDFSVNLFENN